MVVIVGYSLVVSLAFLKAAFGVRVVVALISIILYSIFVWKMILDRDEKDFFLNVIRRGVSP